MRLIFLGKPGSGKGTQARAITQAYGIPAVATGDLIRAAISGETELGQQFKGYTSKGLLVPDELVLAMVAERLENDDCSGGFLLDGFPRTEPQADGLQAMLTKVEAPLDAVLYLKVPDDILVERAVGRRVCKESGSVYHVKFNPPKVEGVCDVSGKALVHRDDDKEDVVVRRLKEYDEKTSPLIEYYKKQGKLLEVDGVGSFEEIEQRIKGVLQSVNGAG
jgi:adenylate kinase|tara:strand:+ start:46 stop:705 length:660 start_codon:yes stop_codon:yes gene_type:complete